MKGSFGPAYHGREDNQATSSSDEQEPDSTPEKKAKPKKDHKRKRSKAANSSRSATCKACDITGHHWGDCFHLFPDKAPKRWNPNPAKTQMIQNSLREDLAWAEEVEQCKKKK